MTEAEHDRKFRLATAHLDERKREALLVRLKDLENQENLSEFLL